MSSSERARPLVSAIIPTYNCSRYLEEAIDSALAQTYPHVEVVVVDDGSTDQTAGVAASYGNAVKYVYQENRGTATARNTGIAHSRGELIALLDHDDRWLPEKLERQVPYFEDPTVGMVHTGGRVIDIQSKAITSEYLPQAELDVHDLMEWCRVGCATTMFRRSVIERVGVFDEALPGADDWDMWIRIAAVSRVMGCPEILVEIGEHPADQGKRINRLHGIICSVIAKHAVKHANCAECEQATRRARMRAREDYYTKACARAAAATAAGALSQAVLYRMSAVAKHPAATLRWPRRILARITR
jgi:glycosyltransferase involved in cell wall biosynthesis